MEVDDHRLILILEAVGPVAEAAWNQPQNQGRCLPVPESDEGVGNLPPP